MNLTLSAPPIGWSLHLFVRAERDKLGEYELKRRVEERRAALMNPVGNRSVTDSAFASRFDTLASVHRNFR